MATAMQRSERFPARAGALISRQQKSSCSTRSLIRSTSLNSRSFFPDENPYEVRLRVAARAPTAERAAMVGDEVEALYTNGPAGGGGTRKYVQEQVGIVSTLIDRDRVHTGVAIREWEPLNGSRADCPALQNADDC